MDRNEIKMHHIFIKSLVLKSHPLIYIQMWSVLSIYRNFHKNSATKEDNIELSIGPKTEKDLLEAP